MNKSFRFAIYPNETQKTLISKTFGCVRFIYNKMLTDRILHYNLTGEILKNTPAQYKAKFDWLREVDSLALCNAQLNLNRAYQYFFKNKEMGFPRFKSKRNNRQSYTTNLVNGNIRLEKDRLVLPKLGGVKIRVHRSIPKEYKLKSVTISRSPSGKYHASILFEYQSNIPVIKPKTFIGLSHSTNELIITSEGLKAEYPAYYQKSLEKLKKAQRKLSRCQKGSRNRNKERIKVARLHEKVANQRKDFLHKLSRQITNGADMVCVEVLNKKDKGLQGYYKNDVPIIGYSMLLKMIDYKLKEQGKHLVRINDRFNTSNQCSKCGEINDHLPLHRHSFQCIECGLEMDWSHNACINLREEGKRQLLA
ncbi:MAG TPA: transposase [Eubacteriaceae bacterium]|nr:transposase [Eubacteriaceae bacterium]